MLGEIQKLLKERGAMSVKELALALQIESGALYPMLEMLQLKGRIEKLELPCGGGCSSCNCSDVDGLTYYKAVAD
jgi:predicted transcriptional regulator